MFDLIWIAKFNDGSELCQYEKDGTENLFQKVLDSQDDLAAFALVRRRDNLAYIVDLQEGCVSSIQLGQQILEPRADMLRKRKYRYRLIYFREIERSFNSTLQEVGETKVNYFLGFQYVDIDNKNHKRIIKINKEGNWVVN